MKRFRDTEYFINQIGVVYRDGNEKRPFKTKGGYKQIQLHIDGVRKKYYIHRMVAECYIPNPENKSDVNHKDLNKENNSMNNLEWCSHRENCQHYQRKIKLTS
jgi:HNH endonuclease